MVTLAEQKAPSFLILLQFPPTLLSRQAIKTSAWCINLLKTIHFSYTFQPSFNPIQRFLLPPSSFRDASIVRTQLETTVAPHFI